MNILSKFNRICFNYASRLGDNVHAASFVEEVRAIIEEHEALTPSGEGGAAEARAATIAEVLEVMDDVERECIRNYSINFKSLFRSRLAALSPAERGVEVKKSS